MKLRVLFLFLGVVFLAAVLMPQASFAVETADSKASKEEAAQIVKIFVKDKFDVAKLANMGLDLPEVKHKNKYVISVISETELKKVASLGYKYKVINPDADSVLRATRAGTLSKYHSFDQIEKILKDAEANNPAVCKLHVIGKSFEGRPIYALNIGLQAGKPAVLIMGLTHAREWISAEVPTALIEEILQKYPSDKAIKELVDNRSIWIVPVVNPDGLVHSQTKSKMWRKNRRLNSDKSYGVDLNRNYGYQWGTVGASTYPGADTYHGVKAFSEPCSAAIKELAEREKFRASVSFHSYSELVLYPFGYAYEAIAKDDQLLAELAKGMAKLNGYTAEKSSDLYPAMGDSDDWMYGAMGALAFTIELGSQFVPNDNEVDKINADNVKSCLFIIEKAGTVHASNHPDFASKVQRAISSFVYYDVTRDVRAATSKTELINLLNPVNDSEGKAFDEFIAEVEKTDLNSKKVLAPVLKEVKDMYTQNIINKLGNTRQVIHDIEKLQNELEKVEEK
ncbi:MAG: Carboxypeptidase T precursor [bacterium ADurb.Bin243]|nr:MAG: Carboxypeptidase T precursor [bacterium ADurb.Bin243]